MDYAHTIEAPEPATALLDDAPEGEILAHLRLARSRNVGPTTFRRLITRFGRPSRALEALPDLAGRGGARDYAPCTSAAAEAEMEAAARAGARLLRLGAPGYPRRLAEIADPPPLLWAVGDTALIHRRGVAVVGARNCSALGQRLARSFAEGVGAAGLSVISGLARGIDAAAHDAALPTGTVAVLAGGVDDLYPPENAALARRIGLEGLRISEAPMGAEPVSRAFPRRNRIVSGLSLGVVLVEAAERSGSLITARMALEQGREAMAAPGHPLDPRSEGCNRLIREGAALVRSAADILEALLAPRTLQLSEENLDFLMDDDAFEGDGDIEALQQQILRLLGPTPVEEDEIARLTGATGADLSLALLELDIAGRIARHAGALVTLASDDL